MAAAAPAAAANAAAALLDPKVSQVTMVVGGAVAANVIRLVIEGQNLSAGAHFIISYASGSGITNVDFAAAINPTAYVVHTNLADQQPGGTLFRKLDLDITQDPATVPAWAAAPAPAKRKLTITNPNGRTVDWPF